MLSPNRLIPPSSRHTPAAALPPHTIHTPPVRCSLTTTPQATRTIAPCLRIGTKPSIITHLNCNHTPQTTHTTLPGPLLLYYLRLVPALVLVSVCLVVSCTLRRPLLPTPITRSSCLTILSTSCFDSSCPLFASFPFSSPFASVPFSFVVLRRPSSTRPSLFFCNDLCRQSCGLVPHLIPPTTHTTKNIFLQPTAFRNRLRNRTSARLPGLPAPALRPEVSY